jgi:hypothetical protein
LPAITIDIKHRGTDQMRRVRAPVRWISTLTCNGECLWLAFWGIGSSVWCLTAASQLGATFDEPLYVTLGLESWRTGSAGPFLRKGMMPLAAQVQTAPFYLWECWRGMRLDPATDLPRLLPWARAMTMAFWWLLLVCAERVGRLLAGVWAGRLAVALLACEPSLLAHASLATTDIAVAACVLASLYHFRTGRDCGWTWRCALPAFWLAAATLVKTSGLVLSLLCLPVVEMERLWRAGALQRRDSGNPVGWFQHCHARSYPFLRDLLWIAGGGLFLVFIYCGSEWRTEPSFVEWARDLPEGMSGSCMTWVAEHLRIFSNAGDALVRQVRHNIRGQGVFLLGRSHQRALWYYFPVVLSIKLSEPLLSGAFVLAILRRRALANWACLAAIVLAMCSVTFRVQLGIRMVLPLVAVAVVGLAAAAVHVARSHGPGISRLLTPAFLCAALVWNVWNVVALWPHGLTYVNAFWGGSEKGYRLVSDSNYDWGQGLPDLARWQQRNGGAPLVVWYFGTDPLLQTLPLHPLPLHTASIRSPGDVAERVRGMYVAVSTTLLYGPVFGEAQRHAVAFFRGREPFARTATFLIYDFTDGALPSQ